MKTIYGAKLIIAEGEYKATHHTFCGGDVVSIVETSSKTKTGCMICADQLMYSQDQIPTQVVFYTREEEV